MAEVEVSGYGAVTPVGIGSSNFESALREGKSNFSVVEFPQQEQLRFPGALIDSFDLKSLLKELQLPEEVRKKAGRFRNVSVGTSCAIYCALEAWIAAGLFDSPIEAERIAIVTGGSNTQLQDTLSLREKYTEKLKFTNPNYAINLFDTDVNGVISELLNIKGEGFSVGGASASSSMALVQAHRLFDTGLYDAVLVVAPMINLSAYEFSSFTNLGAMATLGDGGSPGQLCRPFDNGHAGFVYGQNNGCVLLETRESAQKRERRNLVALSGSGTSLDGNRNPNPSVEGECRAMQMAIRSAGISAAAINYINAHGTASPLGDQTELEALQQAGVTGKPINSTKSIIGHGLTSAGVIEAIATIIQMEKQFIHGSRNLTDPMPSEMELVPETITDTTIDYALSNAFGFGGINTALIFKNLTITT